MKKKNRSPLSSFFDSTSLQLFFMRPHVCLVRYWQVAFFHFCCVVCIEFESYFHSSFKVGENILFLPENIIQFSVCELLGFFKESYFRIWGKLNYLQAKKGWMWKNNEGSRKNEKLFIQIRAYFKIWIRVWHWQCYVGTPVVVSGDCRQWSDLDLDLYVLI